MIKTRRAQLADSTPVQLTFTPKRGVLVRVRNSGTHTAYVSGKETISPTHGYEILAGKEDEFIMPDSYHLYGCSADGLPTEMQVMEVSS